MFGFKNANDVVEMYEKCETPAEQLLYNAKLLVEQERKLNEHDNRISELEAKTTTIPDYYTIAGYGRAVQNYITSKTASVLGKRATEICKENGWEIGKTNDERWVWVNSYPKEAQNQVFKIL